MNLVDKVVSYFSPTSGLRRMQARKVLRTYAGAEANRLTNNRKPRNLAADQELLGPFGADALRAWARDLVRNNAYAWNVVDTIVSNVIGDGITAQSTYETPEGDDVEDVNDFRDKTFSEWCEVCDINGQLTFSEIQALCQREIVEAGEVLVRFIKTPNRIYKGIQRPVPLALEVIEADRLAYDKDTFTARYSRESGNRVVRGVELDEKGKPVAYWIYREHPNSPYSQLGQMPERVLANEVLHLFRKDRVGQSRGVSWFAPTMSWIRDLGVYVDNEIQASAVASCFGVAIKTETPIGSLMAPDNEDSTDSAGNSLEYLEPAMVVRLKPGESVESINPGRPNSASDPWIRLMLRGISAGTGTSYEAISKDFSNTSYSSSRTSKLEDRPRIKRWQNFILSHLCQPVWDEFCNAAAREGLDKFPTSAELLEDRRTVAPVEWQLPEQEWVDPTSEQNAASDSIAKFMSTYQDELGSRGRSWRATFYQAKKEKDLRMRLGLLTEAEHTAQMMAAQTGAEGPADAAQAEQDAQAGSGEWMGLSRLQWQRNRKALADVLNGLADGSMSKALAEAQLAMIGLAPKNVQAIIDDASDGVVDNPVPDDATVQQVNRARFESTQRNWVTTDSDQRLFIEDGELKTKPSGKTLSSKKSPKQAGEPKDTAATDKDGAVASKQSAGEAKKKFEQEWDSGTNYRERAKSTGNTKSVEYAESEIAVASRAKFKEFASSAIDFEAHKDAMSTGLEYVPVGGRPQAVTHTVEVFKENEDGQLELVSSSRPDVYVSVPANASPEMLAHEYAHHIEASNPEVHAACLEFFKKRTKGAKTESLRDNFGKAFEANEKAKDGGFAKAIAAVRGVPETSDRARVEGLYAGKMYPDRTVKKKGRVEVYKANTTEILSVGAELMAVNSQKFKEADPEWFSLVSGLLNGSSLKKSEVSK